MSAIVSSQTHDDDTQLKPRRSIALLVLVLGVIAATGPLATDLYLPAFPQIAADLNVPISQIQLTLTAAMLGLAFGQLLIGPMSDAWGRRRLLLAGIAVFTLTSFLCIFVTSAPTFIALRFAQGMAGAAGAVLSRAVVRDYFEGDNIAKFFSRLVLVAMLAPMLGPILGAQLLRVGPWQLGFVVLTAVAVASFVLVYFFLPESLPPRARTRLSLPHFGTTVLKLVRDVRFIGPALTLTVGFGMMFTYVATFSVVSQTQLGASASQYSVIFALNALALLLGTQINAALIGRVAALRRLSVGLGAAAAAVTALSTMAVLDHTTLPAVTAALFAMMLGLGLVFPNATSLALGSQPSSRAGTGSALIGAMQFTVGGGIPLLAAFTASGSTTFASMTTVMLAAMAATVVIFAVSTRKAAATA